jgi:hypothetical protein
MILPLIIEDNSSQEIRKQIIRAAIEKVNRS